MYPVGTFHTPEDYEGFGGEGTPHGSRQRCFPFSDQRDHVQALWDANDAPPLQETEIKLQTYTGQEIHVLGSITVTAETPGQQACLPLLVVEGSGPSLLSRDWLAKIHLDWKETFSVCVQCTLANILEQHQKVFEPGLGTIEGMKAKLYVDSQAQPAFFKALTFFKGL